MLQCKLCNEEITFDDYHVSERTGKKIPLDAYTEEPHKCAAYERLHKKYYPCRNNCGSQIYFDEEQKSKNGKWIPIDKQNGLPHQCELA